MRRAAQVFMVVALAMPLAAAAQTVTHTTLTAETQDATGKTVATFSAAVLNAGGAPVSGVVTLVDGGRAISSAALDADGKATLKLDSMTAGDHAYKAVYNGDTGHVSSTSEAVSVHPMATATPDFGLSIAPTSLSVKVGSAGTTTATITPENGFTGFISLSCAGPTGSTTLPFGITCNFAPANLQITKGALTAQMSLQTSFGLSKNQTPKSLSDRANPVVLAVLFPGVIGLGMLGRRRKRLGQALLLLVIGGAVLAGTTACNPRYYYLNHGPTYPGTNPGNYTIQVIAQTSNGVTASEHSVDLAVTVTN